MSVKQSLSEVWICISLLVYTAEYLFMCLLLFVSFP